MNQKTIKPDAVIATLNDLVALNRDGQAGYLEAAEKCLAPTTKSFCLAQSRAHAHFVGELQTQLHILGDEPDNTGSVSGAVHRAWMNLKAALGGGDHTVLTSIESFAEHAVSTYRDALAESLPLDARDIVARQFEGIKSAHAEVKALRDLAVP
jgi:uncharacterized protein (TIGR02284 family)